MRKQVVLGVMALLASSTLYATSAQAQGEGTGVEFGLGGGVSIPLSDFDDAAKLGWHGQAAVSFVPQSLPVGFQIDGNFSRFGAEDGTTGGLDFKYQLIYGTGNVVYKFKSSPDAKFRPYILGGVGAYNFDVKGPDADLIPGSSETKFGINAGAGFDIKAQSVGFFVEGRFHDVFTDGPNLKFIPVTVGVRFGGS
jgi:outer membrane protein with beta-barrel domain